MHGPWKAVPANQLTRPRRGHPGRVGRGIDYLVDHGEINNGCALYQRVGLARTSMEGGQIILSIYISMVSDVR